MEYAVVKVLDAILKLLSLLAKQASLVQPIVSGCSVLSIHISVVILTCHLASTTTQTFAQKTDQLGFANPARRFRQLVLPKALNDIGDARPTTITVKSARTIYADIRLNDGCLL